MKIDMHTHPRAINKRGCLESCLKNTFLDGIVFTEHLTPKTDKSEFIEIYLKTVSIGKKYNKIIFAGAELNISGVDFLLYGINNIEDVAKCPLSSLESALDYANLKGGIIIQAHPFRKCVNKIYTLCHGWENNSRERESHNQAILCMANSLGKIVTGGSDSHRGGIGTLYTEFESNSVPIVEQLKQRKYTIKRK